MKILAFKDFSFLVKIKFEAAVSTEKWWNLHGLMQRSDTRGRSSAKSFLVTPSQCKTSIPFSRPKRAIFMQPVSSLWSWKSKTRVWRVLRDVTFFKEILFCSLKFAVHSADIFFLPTCAGLRSGRTLLSLLILSIWKLYGGIPICRDTGSNESKSLHATPVSL